MREISRFLTSFSLFLILILGFGAAFTLVSALMDRTSHLPPPIGALWLGGSGLLLFGCVLAALQLIRKLR